MGANMIDDNYNDFSELSEEQIRNEAIGRKGAKTSRKALAIWALVDWQKQEQTRPDTVKLFREIEARNNAALNEDIKYRDGLSKAASLYYCSEYNIHRNNQIVKGVGLNHANNILKIPTANQPAQIAKLIQRAKKEIKEDMSLIDNMPGMVFNEWTVLSRDEKKRDRVICRCSCGTERSVKATTIRDGSSRSCGCAIDRSLRNPNTQDLIGERFGNLTVLDRNKQTLLCKCDCGTVRMFDRGNVVRGRTKSCGCIQGKVYNKGI